jgi:DNA polymerase elongation subunit (family B)
MDNAIKYGYEFKIIKGYKFDRGRPFEEFINDLYKIRLDYPKSDPMNYCSKLIMNSLYGRFGMNDTYNDIKIVNKKTLEGIIKNNDENYVIKDIFNLGSSIADLEKNIESEEFIIHLEKSENQKVKSSINNLFETHNINIAIASFITAYARIHMSQFKNNKEFKLFYTDTDSVYINKPLNDELVDSKLLGKMKLEYIIKKSVFLAPKLYCLFTEDGEFITKTRGLSHNIKLKFEDYENLLFKDSEIIKNQTK